MEIGDFEVPVVNKLEHDLGEAEIPVIPTDGARQIESIKIPEKARVWLHKKVPKILFSATNSVK